MTSHLHRTAFDGQDVQLPVNSDEMLQLFQRIRRQRPQFTDEMNLLIDVIIGSLSEDLDAALANYWRAA